MAPPKCLKLAARMAGALIASTVLCASTWAAPRPQVQVQCESHDPGPQLDCKVQVTSASGDAVNNAQVQLSAIMPSMAMAHTVKPVIATATDRAGEYQGNLALAMPGVWALSIDLRGPVRDKQMHQVLVKPCADDQRCAATVAAKDHAHQQTASGMNPSGMSHAN